MFKDHEFPNSRIFLIKERQMSKILKIHKLCKHLEYFNEGFIIRPANRHMPFVAYIQPKVKLEDLSALMVNPIKFIYFTAPCYCTAAGRAAVVQ